MYPNEIDCILYIKNILKVGDLMCSVILLYLNIFHPISCNNFFSTPAKKLVKFYMIELYFCSNIIYFHTSYT